MLMVPVWASWALAAMFTVLGGYSAVRVAALSPDPVPVPVPASAGPGTVETVACGCSDETSGERASSLAHAVMALAMATLFLPSTDPVPTAVWIILFTAVAAWFGAGLLRAGNATRWTSVAVHHLIGALAMIYMLVSMGSGSANSAAGTDMSGMDMSGGRAGIAGPVVVIALMLYFGADATSSGLRLFRPAPADTGVLRSVRLSASCRVLMCLGMIVMLAVIL